MKKAKKVMSEEDMGKDNPVEVMDEIKVVDNFELSPRTRRSRYPFGSMVVGQGFILPGVKNQSSVYAAAKRAGVKIATRVTAEGLEVKLVQEAS